MDTDLSVKSWLRSMNEIERKALKIAEEMLGSSFDLSKCNGYMKWIQQHKIMNEYNEFKHEASSIELMKSYNSEWEWFNKKAVFVIFAEYYPYDDKEINPIHFECCNEGNTDFNNWLDKHKLHFEWFNDCVGIVSVKKE
jgi:hypothetical protein